MDHVKSALGVMIKLRDFFRLVLQIAVHDNNPLAPTRQETRRYGIVLAEIAAEPQTSYMMGVSLVGLLDNRP
jgi:hypothetical protein